MRDVTGGIGPATARAGAIDGNHGCHRRARRGHRVRSPGPRLPPRRGPALLLAHYLGEKCETCDFLVELVDAGEMTPFFFVQVKATRKGFTTSQSPPRLRVEVEGKDIRRMVAYPAPTYVVGVHEGEERAFIVSVHGAMAEAIPSITTAHELTCETLRRLCEEVRGFWQGRDRSRSASSFLN